MKVVALVAFMALLAIYAMSARQRSYDLDLPTKELFGHSRVFSSNVAKMRALNEQARKLGRNTRFGITKFAHLTEKEFQQRFLNTKMPGSWRPTPASNYAPIASPLELASLPKKIDWRKHSPPIVIPVKDQGHCGSCWTFSTTGNVEGQWALVGNDLVSLSEQNLVDCDQYCIDGICDSGCEGGLMENAFTWIIKNGGLMSEDDYPYQGVQGECMHNSSRIVANITDFSFVPRDADQMAAFLVKNGPISIAADGTIWQFYMGGVLYDPCGTSLNHGILIVGYDSEIDRFGRNMPYWIVKNSWGPDWGEEGYIYIEKGNNRCGVQEYPISAIITK